MLEKDTVENNYVDLDEIFILLVCGRVKDDNYKTMLLVKPNIVSACFISIMIAIGCIIYFFSPGEYSFYPPCLFKLITGLDCPGCGGIRAVYSLLHGQFLSAADYNLLLVTILPVLLINLVAQQTFPSTKIWSNVNKAIVFVILVCIFWILRNIDRYPFTYLHS